MRAILSFIALFFANTILAQTNFPESIVRDNAKCAAFNTIRKVPDSVVPKKWFLTSFSNVSTGYAFFHGGGVSFLAVPVGLQLNRKLSNNVYAFAGVSAVPLYSSFNRAFVVTDIAKTNGLNSFYQPGNISINPSVSLGLMYVNDARTFSISGSVSVERSSYPGLYNNQQNVTNQNKAIHYSR